MTDLKPCPYVCSGVPSDDDVSSNADDQHAVFCPECGAEGPVAPTEAEAIASWNRRSEVYELGAALMRLREQAPNGLGDIVFTLTGEDGNSDSWERGLYYIICTATPTEINAAIDEVQNGK